MIPVIPDIISYGSSALVRSVTRDIEYDLLAVYDSDDVFAIMLVATLCGIKSSVTAYRISTRYNRCFVCKDYHGAAMSRNTFSPEQYAKKKELLKLKRLRGCPRKDANIFAEDV